MHSIRTQITIIAAAAMIVTMIIATVFGVIAIRDIGTNSTDQQLILLCETGQKNLDSYFERVEQSVEMISAYVEEDLKDLDDDELQAHLDRVSDFFKKLTFNNNGVLTYYYRIDPAVSKNVKGFWFVHGEDGFYEHEVTDISEYDTENTSQLVWFTVPKTTGKSVWLPPYITENLGAKVVSYNVPVYLKNKFVGVIGIELDYSAMADQVDNITLYENGYAFVNDDEGNILYHPHMDVMTLESQPKVPEGMLSNESIINYEFEGVAKKAVWRTLRTGARLNVTVPVSEINEVWYKWVIETVAIFGFLLIFFTLNIMKWTGQITKPLEDLTEVASQVEQGNYDCTLDYDGTNEIGVLTRSFNTLTKHLKSYIGNLNDLAYADALTSLHNKGAFDIYIANMQMDLDGAGGDMEFAICIFDCNDLKNVNDESGHDKGDIYLKETAAVICETFDHSPVFRIGGDEFASILSGRDYRDRDDLIKLFREKCAEKRDASELRWEQIDVACGMAVYDPELDEAVNEVVRRADKLMYENKWNIKGKVIGAQ